MNFGDDDEETQYSKFIKKETYDQLLATFNAVTAGGAKNDGKPIPNPMQQLQQMQGSNSTIDKPNPATVINVLTKQLISSSNDSYNAQKYYAQTQNAYGSYGSYGSGSGSSSMSGSGSCDLVYVPTSFVLEKENLDAFYVSKKMKNDAAAAANVFMQLDMFEQYVKFAKKNVRTRELALIEQSYNATIKRFPQLIDGMNTVLDLTTLSADLNNPALTIPINTNERFTILYTTPTVPALNFLPLASEFTNKFAPAITQKALTYFYNYFQYLYMKNMGAATYSVGRITNYLPALNSNIGTGVTATKVDFTNDINANAKPSYNVEIITDFLRGIITGSLPNRAQLTNQDKFKVIQDKTQLYTFRSTTEYSMNYDALLKHLYYKRPCHLTPSATISKEAKDKIAAASTGKIAAASTGNTTFAQFMISAINAGACDKTKSHSIICAVAIATRMFINYSVKTPQNVTANDMLNFLFNIMEFYRIRPVISANLNDIYF